MICNRRRYSSAALVSSCLSQNSNSRCVVPAGSTPLDLARAQERRTRWSTGRYKPVVAALEEAPRRPPGIEAFLVRFREALRKSFLCLKA